MMTMDQQLRRSASVDATEHSVLTTAWSGVSGWIMACADSYAAWTVYHDLSRLSDAELRRRGLSRDALAREAFKTCDGRD